MSIVGGMNMFSMGHNHVQALHHTQHKACQNNSFCLDEEERPS